LKLAVELLVLHFDAVVAKRLAQIQSVTGVHRLQVVDRERARFVEGLQRALQRDDG
jgi:hypothetical protein